MAVAVSRHDVSRNRRYHEYIQEKIAWMPGRFSQGTARSQTTLVLSHSIHM